MKLNKPKLTKFILNLACKAPMFFPKQITKHSKTISFINALSETLKAEADKTKKLSIFVGDFSWEHVSVSFLVDDYELKKINKWVCFNKKRSPAQDSSNSSSFDQTISISDIGSISFNNNYNLKDFNPIYTECEYFDFVQIFLMRYSSGFSFITLKFNLNDTINELIRNISPPKVENYYEFNHFNFFSKKPFSLNIVNYSKLFNEVIVSEIKKVTDASKELSKLMLNNFGIKDKNKEIFTTLGFEVNRNSGCFNKVDETPDGGYFLYPSNYSGLHSELSSNGKEAFIIDDAVKADDINMIYLNILNEKNNSILNLNDSYIADRYVSILSVFLIKNKLNGLSNRIWISNIYSKKKKFDKFHYEIFEIFQDIKMLKVWIEKLNNNFLFTPKEYHSFVNQEMNSLRERLESLEKVVNDSYFISENRIQMENIKFSKFNSKLIIVLVLIQIFFAAMTIDFTKKDAWYAPIVGFFMEF
nr:hypothetical protein [Providencia rettgeri]